MNARFYVSRFSSEDVIATSDPFIPGGGGVAPDGLCQEIGTLHFFTTGRGRYDASTDKTTAPGVGYTYYGPADFVETGVYSMDWNGRVSVASGKFYYFDGVSYVLCDPQAHAR